MLQISLWCIIQINILWRIFLSICNVVNSVIGIYHKNYSSNGTNLYKSITTKITNHLNLLIPVPTASN